MLCCRNGKDGRGMKSRRIMIAMCAAMTAVFFTASVAFASPDRPVYEDLNYLDGEYWPNVVLYDEHSRAKNFLAPSGDGYWRVMIDDRGVTVTRLTSSFRKVSSKTIKKELKYADGFHAGKNYFYLFFSDLNREENNRKEVLRIVKYDKNWKRLGSASLYGQNAVLIGEFAIRAAEYKNYLFVHTDHTMYKSGDGLNHQANFIAKIRISDMAFIESSGGSFTCSHSFDEHVVVDDAGNLLILNKGDYTGAEVIGVFEKKADQTGIFNDCYFDVFQSAIIENPYTHGDGVWGFENYVYLGGLEYSPSKYLTAGSSLTLDKNWDNNKVSNVFVTVTPRSEVTKEEAVLSELHEELAKRYFEELTEKLRKIGMDDKAIKTSVDKWMKEMH